MKNLTERFIKYVKIYTTSDERYETCPSTERQLDLAKTLCEDMKALSMESIAADANGYVTATLPGNTNAPVIGLIAHMDTAPDVTGENVIPQIIKKYDGKGILLNEEDKTVLSPDDFPVLLNYVDQDLIVTDGTTLLGADDKAGIAEILSAIEYLNEHPEIPHGKIRVGFTPDEEIGRGADLFDVEAFGADFAFTVDGGAIGEMEYENFNAASATIKVQGRSVHTGSAKGLLINSMTIAMRLAQLLPASDLPEKTEGYEGFFHLNNFNGNTEETTMKYIIRDHDRELFEERKETMKRVVNQVNVECGDRVSLELKDTYYNMREKIEPRMDLIDLAKKAMIEADVEPVISPIRGGTDGARLSYMGLLCPNLFTGGHNFHGKFEFIPIQSMEKSVEVLVNLIRLTAQK